MKIRIADLPSPAQMRVLFFILSAGCVCSELLAQLPADGFSREPLSDLEYKLNQRSAGEHPTLQPAAYGLEHSFFVKQDSAHLADAYSSRIRVKPIYDLAAGSAVAGTVKAVGWGYAGVAADWHKEDRWHASLGYAFAGGILPVYVARTADSLRVIPGWGYARSDGSGLYHSQLFFGHIGAKLGKFFHAELGQGKHFWGDGRRSLVLSDVTSPYPYFRLDTRIWKLKYTNLWARLNDFSEGQSFRHRRGKYIALHGLSVNLTKDFNVSLFEMVVWQDRDSLSRRTLDLNYLNPVLFYRPVEFAQGSADNVILGMSMKGKVNPNFQVYMQLVVDEFVLFQVRVGRGWWANKYGGQVGFKWFNAGIRGLHIQAEANAVRPFTYTHGSQIQAWGNLNQPLAHPLGANFSEALLIIRYERNGWKFSEQFTWATYGRDREGLNEGGNIFRSYRSPSRIFGNTMYQGIRSVLHYHQFEVAHDWQGLSGTEVFLSHVMRVDRNMFLGHVENMIWVGIRKSGSMRNRLDF